MREAENLQNIAAEVRRHYPDVALVADIHFLPQAASVAAQYVDKVRINPGNYNIRSGSGEGNNGIGDNNNGGDCGGDFRDLLDKCSQRGVAIRIGVNHGSLSERIVAEYGDTPLGMVASAMEFLRECRSYGFDQVVVSMKSSNTRVMVHAYRLLVTTMMLQGMDFPIHLGVTEAGNGIEGRIKSAVGIGALLADGIGDTIRVSLTEPPENEIPVAAALAGYFAERETACTPKRTSAPDFADLISCNPGQWTPFNPYEYSRRATSVVGRLGGGNIPLLYSELNADEADALRRGEIAMLTAVSSNPVGEWRHMIMAMDAAGDRRPVILHRRYAEASGIAYAEGIVKNRYVGRTFHRRPRRRHIYRTRRGSTQCGRRHPGGTRC